MKTFVLIHGAWHGSWCWDRVRNALERQGHQVYTPVLSGMGEKVGEISSRAGLAEHIDSVVELIEAASLTDVILAGHSYGGFIITGVADRLPERLRQLVFVDAFAPQDGESMIDLIPKMWGDRYVAAANEVGDGYKVPPAPTHLFDMNKEDQQWADAQLTFCPLDVFTDPLHIHSVAGNGVPAIHISATKFGTAAQAFGDNGVVFKMQQEKKVRAEGRGWRVVEFDSGHDVMLDKPSELAGLLMSL